MIHPSLFSSIFLHHVFRCYWVFLDFASCFIHFYLSPHWIFVYLHLFLLKWHPKSYSAYMVCCWVQQQSPIVSSKIVKVLYYFFNPLYGFLLKQSFKVHKSLTDNWDSRGTETWCTQTCFSNFPVKGLTMAYVHVNSSESFILTLSPVMDEPVHLRNVSLNIAQLSLLLIQ